MVVVKTREELIQRRITGDEPSLDCQRMHQHPSFCFNLASGEGSCLLRRLCLLFALLVLALFLFGCLWLRLLTFRSSSGLCLGSILRAIRLRPIRVRSIVRSRLIRVVVGFRVSRTIIARRRLRRTIRVGPIRLRAMVRRRFVVRLRTRRLRCVCIRTRIRRRGPVGGRIRLCLSWSGWLGWRRLFYLGSGHRGWTELPHFCPIHGLAWVSLEHLLPRCE